jgi:NOL1/NOP2/fmu family ribosome biogenesis protein
LSEEPKRLVGHFYEYFDKILVDAPCSGEGMFRKSPAIMKNWEQYGVDYYNKLQKDIIQSAAQMLKPGGYMLYSTCTFSPEENEGTVSWLLDKFPEFTVADALQTADTVNGTVSYEGFGEGRPDWIEQGRPELENCIRLWPHRMDAEGHFIALLKKEASISRDTEYSRNKNIMSTKYKTRVIKGKTGIGRDAAERAYEFLKDMRLTDGRLLLDLKERINIRDNRMYLLPGAAYDLSGLRVLREGLLLGELKKDRFEPSQALANALDYRGWHRRIELASGSENVIKYLKCETINPEVFPEDGWHLVCTDGYPLGWCKIAGGSFRNKYLTAWRWM